MKARSGFTLVEILIVVVILGILAAIVIPQFTEASSEAKESALRADLQTLRGQIQLYKIQHGDALPGAGTGATPANFVQALTGWTDSNGNIEAAAGAGVYGPYVRKIPVNLYVSDMAKRDAIRCVNDIAASPSGNEGTGWWFNAANGDFRACDSAGNIQY